MEALYTIHKIYVEVILVTKDAVDFICPTWKDELYNLIRGIIYSEQQEILEINGSENHVHCILELTCDIRLCDLVHKIQTATYQCIRRKQYHPHFAWESSYSAISFSPSQLESMRRSVRKQEELHTRMNLVQEMQDKMDLLEIK